MHKIIYRLVVFIVLLSPPCYSNYSTDGIPGDFMGMLDKPAAFRTDNLATFIARPFAAGEERDLSFFSKPQASRPKWNQKHQSHTKTAANMKAQDIFVTTGTIFRGLLNNEDDAYGDLVNAAAEGMLGALKGDLGFKEQPSSETEKRNAVREVLNLGRWMKNNLSQHLDFYKSVYNALQDRKYKKHFQMCALYLLAGSGSEIKEGEWYLQGASDKAAVIRKVKRYAQDLLPSFEDDVPVELFPPFNPNRTIISAVEYNSKLQQFYGTPNIRASNLHVGAGKGFARYPANMILGSLKKPNQTKDKTFSITMQIDPHHYFVVMAPSDGQVALLPAYMMKEADSVKSGEEISGNLTIKILSSQGGVRLQQNRVHWSTTSENNNGLLFVDTPLIADDQKTYSFIASVKRPRTRREIVYYYWHPTPLQILQLKGFTDMTPAFTFQQLYDHLQTWKDVSPVPGEILDEIEALKDGRLPKFSDVSKF